MSSDIHYLQQDDLLFNHKPEEDILVTDIFDDIFSEADALSNVGTTEARNLSALVRTLRQVDKDIEKAEASLKSLKQDRQKLTTELIPGLMDEMGVDRLDVDGVTVTRKLIVSASIPEDKREEAFSWLRDNSLDDIIKNDVVVSFGKGQDNAAKSALELLREQGFDPDVKTHIHPQTLKAFVKERIEDGKPIDLDLFGAYVVNAADIRRK
jgi:hypothetical protein